MACVAIVNFSEISTEQVELISAKLSVKGVETMFAGYRIQRELHARNIFVVAFAAPSETEARKILSAIAIDDSGSENSVEFIEKIEGVHQTPLAMFP